MPQRKGLIAPQNTFLDTIATRFDGTHSNFVLGNAQVKGHPIVYCSDGFVELTGYSRGQIMSRSADCSFLWGPKTQQESQARITKALEDLSELQIEVTFHRKNQIAFPCMLDIVPIKNEKGQVVLLLVSHKDLTFERQKAANKISAILGATSFTLNRKRQFGGMVTKRNRGLTALGHSGGFLTAGLATTVAAAALVGSGCPEESGGSTSPLSSRTVTHESKSLHPNEKLSLRRDSTFSLNEHRSTLKPTSTSFPRRHSLAPSSELLHNLDSGIVCNKPSSPNPSPSYNLSPRRKSFEDSEENLKSDENTSQLTPLLSIDSPREEESKSFEIAEENQDLENSDLETDQNDKDDSNDSSIDEPSSAYKFQRRRSRAVLYNLSGRFESKPKRKMPLKKIQNFSGKEAVPEYRVQDVQPSKLILLHYSIWKIIWDWLILACTFYIGVMVPYNAAFSVAVRGAEPENLGLKIVDIFIGLLFVLDVVLNFLTTYVSKSGQVVYEPKQIALHYIRGWLMLDLIAAIPFDLIFIKEDNATRDTVNMLKLTRLLRLLRLILKIERYTQHSAIILGLLMGMFTLISHWFACIWYAIGKYEYNKDETKNHCWLAELGNRLYKNQSQSVWNDNSSLYKEGLYVSALYYTTSSLTSVGFGNISPNTANEKIFSIITMLSGALMHAVVFGNVTTIIQRMYARRTAYQTKHQDLKDFTRAHHIPKPLKQRMVEFFQAMWSINRGIDKQMIMDEFPEELRGEIALQLNREMLSLTLFKNASPGCLKSIAITIKTRFATPGEYLVHRGDVIKFIYFVCNGSLEILDEEGIVVALLGKCDLFGCDIDDEREFIGHSAYDVKSLTYCELQYLEINCLVRDILNQYPIFKQEFANSLHDELSFNIREGYDPSQYSRDEILSAITIPLPAIQESEERESSEDEYELQTSDFGLKNDLTLLKENCFEELDTFDPLALQELETSRDSTEFPTMINGQRRIGRRLSEINNSTGASSSSKLYHRQAFFQGRSQSVDESTHTNQCYKSDCLSKQMRKSEIFTDTTKRFALDDIWTGMSSNNYRQSISQINREFLTPITEMLSRNSPEENNPSENFASLPTLDNNQTSSTLNNNNSFSWKRRMSVDSVVLSRMPAREAKDRWLNQLNDSKNFPITVTSPMKMLMPSSIHLKPATAKPSNTAQIILRMHKDLTTIRGEIDQMHRCMLQINECMQSLAVQSRHSPPKPNDIIANSIRGESLATYPQHSALKNVSDAVTGSNTHAEGPRVVTFELPPKNLNEDMKIKSPGSLRKTLLKKRSPEINPGDQQTVSHSDYGTNILNSSNTSSNANITQTLKKVSSMRK